MREIKSTCCYCGVGCGVIITENEGQIAGVRGDPDHPANFGRLCTKGSTLHLTASSEGRAFYPELRKDRSATRARTDWDQALDHAVDRFADIIEKHGPDSVAFYVSGQLLTEDYYVFNKLSKGLIGTNNIDTNSRLCMSSAVAGYKTTLGMDAPPACYADIAWAHCIFITGSNMAYAHPILFRHIEDARREHPDLKLIVVDPRRSALISENLKRFAVYHNINSILYVPLNVNGEITHFMTFDALDQRQRYREDEIEIFIFLGRELMKAQKMERLDDILHDFKNPAIATAGFARRLKKLIEQEQTEESRSQVLKYADILLQETSRMQELALSIYQVGEEQVVNLTEVLQRRFEINKEAIKEQLRQNVVLEEGPFDPVLHARCYPIHLERVFDNLLNNATKAIPLKGGVLAIRTYAEREWGCAEITNTGQISEDDRLRFLEGEGQGRGLYITHRIIRLLKGKIEIQGGKETTTFKVCLPLHRE